MASTPDPSIEAPAEPGLPARKPLSPAAERALQEAALRRAKADSGAGPATPEVGGPTGPEPTRYGDWEKKGLTSDF